MADARDGCPDCGDIDHHGCMGDRPTIPHRRLRLWLDLQADSLDHLHQALVLLADDLDHTGIEQCQQTSGGYHSGHHFTLTCDPAQTGDRYREQLEAWRQARIAKGDG